MTFRLNEHIHACTDLMARILMRQYKGLELEKVGPYLYQVRKLP